MYGFLHEVQPDDRITGKPEGILLKLALMGQRPVTTPESQMVLWEGTATGARKMLACRKLTIYKLAAAACDFAPLSLSA